jgi:hypothetical protein
MGLLQVMEDAGYEVFTGSRHSGEFSWYLQAET